MENAINILDVMAINITTNNGINSLREAPEIDRAYKNKTVAKKNIHQKGKTRYEGVNRQLDGFINWGYLTGEYCGWVLLKKRINVMYKLKENSYEM